MYIYVSMCIVFLSPVPLCCWAQQSEEGNTPRLRSSFTLSGKLQQVKDTPEFLESLLIHHVQLETHACWGHSGHISCKKNLYNPLQITSTPSHHRDNLPSIINFYKCFLVLQLVMKKDSTLTNLYFAPSVCCVQYFKELSTHVLGKSKAWNLVRVDMHYTCRFIFTTVWSEKKAKTADS